MAKLRKAGWEPVLGRYRDGYYLFVTFGAPVEQPVILNAYE